MDQLIELKNKLTEERPADWTAMPDIELYKDQVLSYMQRQHTLDPEALQLTGAMINNYIKSGLLPRANGKKYNKNHLAYLTAICALKQVLSVSEADLLMKAQPQSSDAKEFYQEYCDCMDTSLKETAERLNEEWEKDDLAKFAFRLAVDSYVQKLASKKILEILNKENR